MTQEPAVSEEMVTVFVAADPADQALAESTLRGSGVPFAIRHAGVQDLIGAGQIGGFNVVTGPPEIQVAAADADRAVELLRESLDQAGAGLNVEAEPAEEVAFKALALRYARWSAAWSLLSLVALWGASAPLGIYFGIQSLRRSQGALTLTRMLAVVGLTLGLLGVLVLAVAFRPVYASP